MVENTPKEAPRNTGLWVGIGCVSVLVLSCCLLTYWVQSYGWRWILRQGDDTKIWASRMILVGALEGTRKTCVDGAIGEDALPWFHPDMPAQDRNVACTVDEAALRALATPEQASATLLSQTDRKALAAQFGMDATLCIQHAADGLLAVGCFNPEGGPGTIPYQIIDLALSSP